MSLWADLKNIFFPPRQRDLEEHNRHVRNAVHADRNEAMETQAKQTKTRQQIDEIYRATRTAVRRLQQQQGGQDRRPGNHDKDKDHHRPEHPSPLR